MAELTVGSHVFSLTDARRTLRYAHLFLDLMAEGRDGSPLAPMRAEIDRALLGVDPDQADEVQLAATLPAVWSTLLAAGPALRAAGQLPGRAVGHVVQVSVSHGGVPKHPAAFLDVGYQGAAGDGHRSRQHHGAPFQALCLWSEEVIEAMRAEGHGIFPGAAGENVTLSGLDWADVRPGVRLALGTVLCEVASFATPCAKNAEWFVDREFQVMSHERGPVSRVYATVRTPGRIEPGDDAVLEP